MNLFISNKLNMETKDIKKLKYEFGLEGGLEIRVC